MYDIKIFFQCDHTSVHDIVQKFREVRALGSSVKFYNRRKMRECPKYALISPVCLVHLVALQIKHLFFSPQLSLTPCDPMDCSTPGFLSFPISQNFLKLMSMGLVMPTNHLVPFPPTFNLSQHQSFLSQLFSLRGQSDGASASASVLPMNIQD